MPDPALPGTEQVPQGTPPPAQQSPVQQQEPPNQESSAPAEATPEQIAAWRQQAESATQLAQQLQQATESARYHQGNASRYQQALQQVAGGQPQAQPQDPLTPYVQQLTGQGYSEKDARAIAGMNYAMVQQHVAPLQQQLQQSQQQLQGGLAVDQVLQSVYQKHPALFANQAVYDQTRAGLMQTVMAGGQIDPQYAKYAAVIANFEANEAAQSQARPGQVLPFTPAPPQQQQPIPQPFNRGMFGVTNNFQPQPQIGPAALPADADWVSQEMRTRFNLPPKTA